MIRFLLAVLAGLVLISDGAGAQPKVIRAVMHSDLKILDPVWTPAYIVRTHGYMVWDTLFALDEHMQVRPQMVDRYEVSADRLTYTFTLRDGLKWHDGSPVTGADCIASIRRWAKRDSMGQKLMDFVASLDSVDDGTFRIILKEPYGLVLESLAKPGSPVPFMMPRRIAETDPSAQISEIVGSGPFIFKRDEWKPGDKTVYIRNPHYKPRLEPASWLAGGKVVNVDRVEWLAITDSQIAVNALLAGEIDYIESPPHDLLPLLKDDRNVTLMLSNTLGWQYDFRFNALQPPFNNEKVRRAAMIAFNQEAFLKASVGDPAYYRPCPAMFVCGTPLETTAGMQGLLTSDFVRSRQLLKEAGYDGQPVVLLHTTNSTVLTNVGLVAKSLLEQGGFKVDIQPMDFQTLATRRLRKGPPSEGGWSGFMTAWVSVDMMNPLTNALVNAGCDGAYFGWPCDRELEALRDQFARAASAEEQKGLAAEIQSRAATIGTHVPLGQYHQPIAFRSDRLTDVPATPVTVFWSIGRKAN